MHESLEIDINSIKTDLNKYEKLNNAVPYPIDMEMYKQLQRILNYDSKGHIFITAHDNTNIRAFIIDILNERYKTSPYLYGCYVYNFEDPYKPLYIELNEVEKKMFIEDVERFKKHVKKDVLTIVERKEFNISMRIITEGFKKLCEKRIDELKKLAVKMGFITEISNDEIYFTPINNGEKMNREEYDGLDVDDKEAIINKLSFIESKAKCVKQFIEKQKLKESKDINDLKKKVMSKYIKQYLEEALEGFNYQPKIVQYFKNMANELLNDVICFFRLEILTEKGLLDYMTMVEELFDSIKYQVNILNKDQLDKGAAYKTNVDYYSLFGKICYENIDSDYRTNHTLICSGLLIDNNNKYLVINVKDLLSNALIYNKFKECLIDNCYCYDDVREKCGGLSIKSIEPEAIKLNVRVVVIGSSEVYNQLIRLDDQFSSLFNYHFDIDKTMPLNEENVSNYICYLEDEGVNQKTALRLIETAIRETGIRNRISTNVKRVNKLMAMSKEIALNHKLTINSKHISDGENMLLESYRYNNNRMLNLIEEGTLLISVKGAVVGQVNGLAITEMPDCKVATPIRITSTVGVGENRVISIDDKSKVTGKIFNKGINIIRGFLNQLIFNQIDSGYECYVCFEQVYGIVEGDSAMLGIVTAIVSAFADLPIRQDIAVTGSMDQKGNVQPIGGVSDKILGFYNACKVLGRHDGQGVIVPRRNFNDIVLTEEVIDAIENKQFHIYLVDEVKEVIEILLNEKISSILQQFNYMLLTP